MDDDVKFWLTVYGPILTLLWLIVILDWAGRRTDRKSQKHKPA